MINFEIELRFFAEENRISDIKLKTIKNDYTRRIYSIINLLITTHTYILFNTSNMLT